MPRVIHADQARLFRTVVTYKFGPDARTHVAHFGPYSTVGAAKAAIRRERRKHRPGSWWQEAEVTGHIESAALAWVAVTKPPLDAPDLVEDGHGMAVQKCRRPDCGLHVVRPGEVQCWCDDTASQ